MGLEAYSSVVNLSLASFSHFEVVPERKFSHILSILLDFPGSVGL